MTESGSSKRIWIVAVVVVLLGLVLAAWGLRPAYRTYKERRSLAQAQAFIASGDYRNALLSLRQTLVLNPTNLIAAKIMADFATQTQSPSALSWWQRVVDIDPSWDNQALLASAALRLEGPPYPIAAKTIDGLASGAATNVVYHLLASQLALKLSQNQIADQHLERALQLEPTNQAHRVNLATVRLNSRVPEISAAAREELNPLVRDPVWGVTVLRALATDALNRTNRIEALDYAEQLHASTNATIADRMQYLAAVRLARPEHLAQLLVAEQKRCGTNLVQIAQLAVWQNQSGQAKATLEWFEQLDIAVRAVPPMALVEADARLTLQDWTGLETQLTPQRWEDQEFIRLAYLARAFKEQGRTTMSRANWERSVGATFARIQNAAVLAQVAFSWRWQEEAVDLLWQSARRWSREDWPLQNLMRFYVSVSDSEGLFRVYEMIYSRHPEVLPAKNNFVMLGLLLRKEPERMMRLATELNDAGSTNGIFASTYALALHQTGRTTEGLEIIKRLPEAERNRPEVRPYWALLRAALGNKADVAAELNLAADQAVLPEERELFRAAAR